MAVIGRDWPQIPVRSFRKWAKEGDVLDLKTPCPTFLVGDDTAFAIAANDEGLAPVIRAGVLLYCTKLRVPAEGDIAFFLDNEGVPCIRVVESVSDECFDVFHLEADGHGAFAPKKARVVIDDLAEIALVAGSRNISG